MLCVLHVLRRKKIWDFKTISSDHNPSSHSKIIQSRKITHYMTFSGVSAWVGTYICQFSFFSALAKSQGALRDLTCAPSQKIWDFWKNFLRSQSQLLHQNRKISKPLYMQISGAFGPLWMKHFDSFHFQCFGITRGALRDLTWAPSLSNLRLVKKILEIKIPALIPKYTKAYKMCFRYISSDLWPLLVIIL